MIHSIYPDTYRHKGLRHDMVENLKPKGITDMNVLRAMRNLPRHFFLESAFSELAYQERALHIGEGQTISQPYTVAYQSQLLEIKRRPKVLEIGTGSGYQAGILCEMGCRLTTIEYNRELYNNARILLKKIGYKKVNYLYGDGSQGNSIYAPYDRILVTAAAPKIPMVLVRQLAVNGLMVIPVGDTESQQMLRIRKLNNDGKTKVEVYDDFSFVPLLGKNGWQIEEETEEEGDDLIDEDEQY